tara:strand:- start:7064 stop:9274 length:2211 start_codon:yes stop_codon:yes gene_type:complete
MFLIDFLRDILEFFYGLTSNYGVAIVFLSLSVTVIMLPLYWVIELFQRKDVARKSKMQVALDKLKDVRNKQEKYYYTRRIYKQHSYSPFYSLTSLLGLLVQVPFFFAAYWMLLEYAPLEGLSFGPIQDLSKPDELISIRGFTINVLPFLMTAANLYAGYLYTSKIDKNGRIQLVLISLVFLVLLYSLSSALVIYWTLNNVFSIGKNWLIKLSVKEHHLKLISSERLQKIGNNRYMIYPLLFSIFPLLSFYYENIEELFFSQLNTFLLLILLLTFLLLLLLKLIFKEPNKVVLFSFLVIALFFSFGHVYDALIEVFVDLRPFVILGLYGILFVVGFFFILKAKRQLNKAARILKILSVCLFSIISVSIIYHNLSSVNSQDIVNPKTAISSGKKHGEPATTQNDKHPDIYYIVMDGYANSGILKDYHNFDNSAFEKFLTDKGFYIPREARSNYVLTHLSLASTLNMKYINHLKKKLGAESKNTRVPFQMIRESKVMQYLSEKGYKNVHFSSGWGGTDRNENADYNYTSSSKVDEFSLMFLNTTILSPFIEIFSSSQKNYRKNIIYTLDNIAKLDNIKEPKFVFAHIVCPHPPYVFDKNGGKINQKLKLSNSWKLDERNYYLDQMTYLNKKVEGLVEKILNRDSDAVIILQADHGSAFYGDNWENPSTKFTKERSKIFSAILLSQDGKKQLYTNMTSVNTFRVVLNSVFDENFKLLDDRTYFSSYEKPYKFKNVTKTFD